MRPVLTPAEAAELDRATQALGIMQATLMARAGWSVARAGVDLTGGCYGRRAVVVCGGGNNGGDGLIAAEHLSRWGMRVAVHRPPDADMHRLVRDLDRADLVIDAIFGTGLHGAASGPWAAAIEAIGGARCPIVSVDIASGVDGETGEILGPVVAADLTVAFGAPKVGSVLLPGAQFSGDVRVVDIGFPDALIPRSTGLTEPADIDVAIPDREIDGHKKGSGVVLVVAGSRAMPGAARLVAEAAFRVGAGYVIVAAPASALGAVRAGLPEAVTLPLPETDDGFASDAALDVVLSRAGDGVDALAIGPGLGTHPSTAGFVRALVRESPVPFVLDADGLNAFAGEPDSLAERKADAVLTPHLGEAARLGIEGTDRLSAAREMAARADAVALVKGTRTVIAEPGGAARINPTGTAVLATAGTGDVLTGAIAGLAARGLSVFDAAWVGAYAHGLAGMSAGRDLGDGVVAGDVASRLPEAIAFARSQA